MTVLTFVEAKLSNFGKRIFAVLKVEEKNAVAEVLNTINGWESDAKKLVAYELAPWGARHWAGIAGVALAVGVVLGNIF